MGNPKLNSVLFDVLIECKNYRFFLAEYLVLRKEAGENLSKLSARAGLKSAGFLSDVIKGKKKLSAKSLPALKEALKVPAGLDQYFEYLVYLEHSEMIPRDLKGEKFNQTFRQFRSRLKEKFKKSNISKSDTHDMAGSFDAHLLFAALEPDRGLLKGELQERTGLGMAAIDRALELFKRMQLIYEFENKFFPQQENYENFGEQFNSSFQITFLKALSLLQAKAQKMTENQRDLFYISTFLVNESDYEELQLKLKDKLFQEMDKTLPASGEKVATMVFSIFLPTIEDSK